MIQLGRGRASCRPGKQFGSETVVYDFLPDEQLRQLLNLTASCWFLTSGPAAPTGAIFYRDAGMYGRAIRRGTGPMNQVEGFAEELRLRSQ